MTATVQAQHFNAPAEPRPRSGGRGRAAPVTVEEARAFLAGLTRDQHILGDASFIEKVRRGLQRERGMQQANADRERRERLIAAQA